MNLQERLELPNSFFDNTLALNTIIPRGCGYILSGETKSGKSTLLKML